MEDLIPEYKDTRKALQRKREELKRLRDSKKEERTKLMAKVTLPTTFQAERDDLEAAIVALESEMKTYGEMISDSEFILEWLETGRRPGNKRGIERRAAYQREKPIDPVHLQAYIAKTSSGGAVQVDRLSERERERIEFALGELSLRERECYEMVIGGGLSYGETAEITGLSKSSIQWFVDEAKKKLHHHSRQVDLFDLIT
ncbi:Fis family transcriptional regulator [Paenibacillus alvei]|uniref:sigma factor-like helix-turn-helix DNA-binding protein n=1 Tax=Paenibacillus alvei TaxID=44250 RepID=UPI00028A38AC|nr:sigma factor-like helix-turn-helix DNA-binding protein [Paenibacillus alvei]EJW14440.1 DNA-directed RNA polymerase specialized sigma subunit, sigma24-like protein [Paenibacillus alvei DSM 29]MCY9545199.1 Fis family transcriptional regulator [Paenibacillus alvei]MCY9708200.1 Fis family transcriptional regulator [Paenibacillus alvei]MCY9758440.1 Fis family transcriptional regulator [Paenibacillus alvei]MEC0080228.1 sigma factor-like helix-turn-helix DNA-binding protein [Paenibacillus alvei]